MADQKRIEHDPQDFLEVRALKRITWNGETLNIGDTFVAKRYEMDPAIKAGQVEAVATLPDYQPEEKVEELVTGKAPVKGGGK